MGNVVPYSQPVEVAMSSSWTDLSSLEIIWQTPGPVLSMTALVPGTRLVYDFLEDSGGACLIYFSLRYQMFVGR